MSNMTHEADILIRVTVQFADNGEDDLRDQVMDALNDGPWFSIGSMIHDNDAELQGDIRTLAQKDTQNG